MIIKNSIRELSVINRLLVLYIICSLAYCKAEKGQAMVRAKDLYITFADRFINDSVDVIVNKLPLGTGLVLNSSTIDGYTDVSWTFHAEGDGWSVTKLNEKGSIKIPFGDGIIHLTIVMNKTHYDYSIDPANGLYFGLTKTGQGDLEFRQINMSSNKYTRIYDSLQKLKMKYHN
ncbi:MAG TPA: hypothetical protein VFR58_03100 [Flavisolibacter sp.]|nr:hypothetical protein [Flavisolibacter sp.]